MAEFSQPLHLQDSQLMGPLGTPDTSIFYYGANYEYRLRRLCWTGSTPWAFDMPPKSQQGNHYAYTCAQRLYYLLDRMTALCKEALRLTASPRTLLATQQCSKFGRNVAARSRMPEMCKRENKVFPMPVAMDLHLFHALLMYTQTNSTSRCL